MSTRSDFPQLTEANIQVDRLVLKAGRLSIDLDAQHCHGTILLDETRFPVKGMTLKIVAGQPMECVAHFWIDPVNDSGHCQVEQQQVSGCGM